VKPIPCLLALASTMLSTVVLAQGKTDYSLNDGQVNFHVPGDWTALMEKTEGNPQAIAFEVPDASAQGSEDTASVTVKTRELANPAQYSVVVQDETSRARSQPGYEADGVASDDWTHRYFVMRGKTKYRVHDSFVQRAGVAVEVRCQRPLLASTPEAWNTQFDGACASVVASLRQ
jgi:hypothetical protein